MVRRVVVSALACLAALPAAADAAGRYDVTVARTQFGIPHIQARDYRSLGYGYGYSLAQDAACVVADSYVTVNAQRSRYFGPEERQAVGGNGTEPTNLDSDLFHQRIIDRGTVERLAAQAPPLGPKPEVRQVLGGYVAGWNAWLRAVGGRDGVPDRSCRGKPWVRPITIEDVYRRFYSLTLLASAGTAIEGIANARPLAGGADARATARSLPAGELDRRLGGLGSNAYAIGRDGSQDGHGLLYGNPHFPWHGSERFYQAQLTIPGKLDVTGGSLLGVPVVLIGTTRGVAWSHTVSTARRFVPYQLTLVPGSPTSYVEDGKVKRMRADRVTVHVRERDGSIGTRTRTLWSSEHGPILTSLLGLPLFPWTPLNAYALHDGNAENVGRLLNHYFDVNRARSVDDIDATLRRYLGLPWVNTIAADTAGTAYYADIGSIPDVDAAKYSRCQTALGAVTDQLQRLPVLDGSRSSCRTGREPGAVAPGILGPGQLPSLRRTDHVSNMNDSYWLSNPLQPLEGFSRIVGDERSARSLRTRIGIKQLQERLAGTDGLPGRGFTLDTLTTVGLRNRVYSGELWRDGLVRGCTSEPCAVLRGWDLRNDLDSEGALLWQRFVARLGEVDGALLGGLLGPFTQPFDSRRPVDTPSGLNVASPTVQGALRDAADDLRGAGLPLDATLRRGQTVTRRGEAIPIHGGPGGAGNFNVITPDWDPRRGYTEVQHGSSFIQAVHLRPGCPELRTLLTYGLSPNPDSPHTSDQTKRFSAKRWVKPPFCPGELERDRSARWTRTEARGTTAVSVREARGRARPRITLRRASARRARVVVRVRQGRRVVRRLARRAGRTLALSTRVRRGRYRVEVAVGGRVLRVAARQR